MQPLKRILFVKLSDIGDVLSATPALRALRQSLPGARIEVLAPPRSAGVLRGLSSVDEVIVFDKFGYDAVQSAFAPAALRAAVRFCASLRGRHYDALLL